MPKYNSTLNISNIFAIVFICFFSLSQTLFCHPHVFVEAKTTFQFDKEGLASINVHWTFDELFSTMIINDYDKNKNKAFESKEIKAIKDEAFSNLKNHHYFTYVKINQKSFDVSYVTNFHAAIKNDRIIYTFCIPCHVKAGQKNKEISVAYYDESYFIALEFAEKVPVNFQDGSHIEKTYRVKVNKNDSFDTGTFNKELIMHFKKKG